MNIKPAINEETTVMLDSCATQIQALLLNKKAIMRQSSFCYSEIVEIHRAIHQQVNIIKALVEVGMDYPIT